jgi:hypothetical protein
LWHILNLMNNSWAMGWSHHHRQLGMLPYSVMTRALANSLNGPRGNVFCQNEMWTRATNMLYSIWNEFNSLW